MTFRFRSGAAASRPVPIAARRPTAVAVAVAILTLLTVLTASTAFGHDTWLLANGGNGRVGTPLTVSLTSGEAFPIDDFAIDPARVTRAVVRQMGKTTALPQPVSGALALRYTWTPARPGVATLGVELAAKTLTLAPGKIDEYLAEIDATPAMRATWNSLRGKRPWVESYSKHAVTYVRVGDARDSSWREPLGFRLEIVPERDPTALRARDTLIVRVLRAGSPMSNIAIGAIREGRDKTRFSRTDSSGRARIIFDAGGRWLLNGTDLQPSTNPQFTWESNFVTTTIHVAPR